MRRPPRLVLHLKQMGNTFTVRLPRDLAEWLDQTARSSGTSRGQIIRLELERARRSSKQPFLRHAGAIEGPADLSTRKGFSRK
jgi:predicted transcriptional regulator